MEDSPRGWRACYRHPKKPAIRDCADCGKPICGVCAGESGDPALCPSCKEAVASGDEAAEAPVIELPRVERHPLTISEVTIHDDGRVEAPAVAGRKVEVPEDNAMTTPPTIAGEEEAPQADARQKEPARRPIVKKPLSEEAKPAARAPTGKQPGRAMLLKAAPPLKQLKAALPYGLAACICIMGFWLLLAALRHQWTQAAVFTTGIAVPWALTKGSTVKKKMGLKVWKGPPHPAWIGLLSVGIMLPLVPLAEFLAYRIVSRGTYLVNAGSKFMSLYFDLMGVFLIASGFILAFGVPYVLSTGERWSAPFQAGRVRERVSKVLRNISRRATK
ncbi:MAG: hypothetical protein MUP40_02755 [Actinobacteria bacterium]|nr:hypothetical protein [Actinomycetota bacterium]